MNSIDFTQCIYVKVRIEITSNLYHPRMDAFNVGSRKMLGLKCGLVYLILDPN